MMLTPTDALRAYAKMMNTLSLDALEPILDDNFVYESQAVFSALESKQDFLDYMRPKLDTVKSSNAVVFAEMGMVDAYGCYQPCVVLAQHSKDNLLALVIAEVKANRLARLDLCLVPTPDCAERSGEYPV